MPLRGGATDWRAEEHAPPASGSVPHLRLRSPQPRLRVSAIALLVKSAKTYLIVLLALTTIGGAVLSWQQYTELNELRNAALSRTERADLQKRVWDLEKQNKQLAARASSRSPDDPLVPGDPADRRERGGPGRGPGGNPMQQFAALRDVLAKPEVQALLTLQQKAAVEARYAALFKSLNLTHEQAERLKSILADRATTMQDAASIARDQGIDPRRDPDGYKALMESTRADINNSIKAVVGDSGFAQFESYENTLPQRNVVNQLQWSLSQTDTPITSAQAEQLVQILASNPAPPAPRPTDGSGNPPPPPPGGRGGVDPAVLGALLGGGGAPGGGGLLSLGDRSTTATAPITNGALNQSQTVLSGPQLNALQQLQQQQQNQQQLTKIVTDTLTSQPNGPPPPRGGKK